MNVSTLKCAAIILCAALVFNIVSVPVFALGDAGAGNNGNMRSPSLKAYEDPPSENPSANGGGPGNNNNSPAAGGGGGVGNGGDEYAGNGGVPYNGGNAEYSGESEAGEVLGVADDSTAVVGIVIAIIIAVAALILIIALIPRGTKRV